MFLYLRKRLPTDVVAKLKSKLKKKNYLKKDLVSRKLAERFHQDLVLEAKSTNPSINHLS